MNTYSKKTQGSKYPKKKKKKPEFGFITVFLFDPQAPQWRDVLAVFGMKSFGKAIER
jgi:hypothetical protein